MSGSSLSQDFYPQGIYDDFLSKINVIVCDYLKEYAGKKYHPYPGEKVIHDPVWGSVKFTGSEIKIIDTPLFQRLRDIYQVGLGVFTYPSARHSRFEHSLGTVAIAARMIDRLKNNPDSIIKINDYDVHDVRFAALLHDIGHCFYSHLSETYYSKMSEFVHLTRYFNTKYQVKPKAHEIFSYLIINTQSFKDFIIDNSIFDEAYIVASGNIDELMSRIGNLIIGVANNGRGLMKNKKMSFITRLINGDIDADKLDYIRRDSHTSGLPLTFDIERLLYKMKIREAGGTDFQLVVDIAGITAIEEIVFSKLMLNHYIYHHQKVLATETMAKDIALALIELKIIKHPTDFLKFTDAKIESLIDDNRIAFADYGCQEKLGFFINRVKNRYLPKRCFEISSRVFEKAHSDTDRKEQELLYIEACLDKLESMDSKDEQVSLLYGLCADLFEFTDIQNHHFTPFLDFLKGFNTESYKEYTENIRKDIYESIHDLYKKTNTSYPDLGITVFDVHISVPKTINEQILFDTPIIYRNNQETYTNMMMSYTKNWAQAFNDNKWCGYVFVSPHIDTTIAFKAALSVLKKCIGIDFSNPDYYIKRLDTKMMEKIDETEK